MRLRVPDHWKLGRRAVGIMEKSVGKRFDIGFLVLMGVGVLISVPASDSVWSDAGLGIGLYSAGAGITEGAIAAMALAVTGVTLAVAGAVGLTSRLVRREDDGEARGRHVLGVGTRRAFLVISVAMTIMPMCLLAVLAASMGQLATYLLVGMYQTGLLFGMVPLYSVVAGAMLGIALDMGV